MRVLKHRWVRSAAVLTVAAAAAGCSTDVARLDSFYSGAVPQATQTAQLGTAPMSVDTTNTGSIGQTYPSAAPMAGGGGYGASAVTRSQLPPPPGAASYQPATQPGMSAAGATSLPPAGAPTTVAAVPAQRPAAAPASTTVAATPAAQPAPQQTAAVPGGRTVTVQSGDSLNAIARRTGVSVAQLREANGLATDNIRIGQTLNLPGGSANTQVASLGAPATTLQAQAAQQPAPAVAAPAPVQAAPAPAAVAPAAPAPAASAAPTTVAAETQTAAIAPASTGISEFRWPVQGRVVKGFGDRIGSRRNDGVNISVPQGSPVKAAENGVVIYAGEGLKEFGKTVLIKHDNGLVTVYGHADEILVERGATVTRGQDIAKAGMTGETDVPILHFEVRKDSTPVDPMTYLG